MLRQDLTVTTMFAWDYLWLSLLSLLAAGGGVWLLTRLTDMFDWTE